MAKMFKEYSKDEWEKKLSNVRVTKVDMNKLVMNFFVTKGYADVAEKFQEESGTESGVEFGSIAKRVAIKKAVENGDIKDAIEKTNDLNPEILGTNPELSFLLQLEWLKELIRRGKHGEALEFGRTELARKGEENKNFLDELGKSLTLLAYEDLSALALSPLLDISHRYKAASELNTAILVTQNLDKEPMLCTLLKMFLWAQHDLSKTVVHPGMYHCDLKLQLPWA